MRFVSERFGFEVVIPSEWSAPPTNWLARLIGLDRKLIFRGPAALMHCDVRAFPGEAALDEREAGFNTLAMQLGHAHVRTGRIRVGSKDHLWARYRIGEATALSMAIGREMLSKTKQAYADVVEPMSLEQWVRELYANGVGPFVKTYFLVLGRKEITVNCSLGIGTVDELDGEVDARGSAYDTIVSTMECSTGAEQAGGGSGKGTTPFDGHRESYEECSTGAEQTGGGSGKGTTPFDGHRESYELFVSYRSSNANAARAIVDQLIASGIDPWFAEYMIRLRDEREAFGALMEKGLACSGKGMLLLNPTYADSEHCLHELTTLTANLPSADLFAVCPKGIEWNATLPPLPATLIETNSTREVLQFVARQLGRRIDPIETSALGEEPRRASCYGIPYSLDLTGWRDVQSGDIVAPHEPERGFSAARSTPRGLLKMTLAHGGLEEEHDPSSRLNGAKSDRDLYDRALDWVRGYTDRYGHSVRGIHLVHLDQRTHLAVTYHSGAAIWMRKYAIILPHPSGRRSMEFVFSFGSSGTFRELLGMTGAMEQVVLSLRWPDMSEAGVADMCDRAERLTRAGRGEMAEELRSIASGRARDRSRG